MRHKLIGHDNSVTRILPSPTERLVATVSHDYSVRIWDMVSGAERYTLLGHRQRPTEACFASDGKLLATAGMEGEVKVWDVGTGQELMTLTDFECREVTAIGFQGSRTLAALGELSRGLHQQATRIGTWQVDPAAIGRIASPVIRHGTSVDGN